MSHSINGKTLIEWGFTPGKGFADFLSAAQHMEDSGFSHAEIAARLEDLKPEPIETIDLRTNALPFRNYLEFDTGDEYEISNRAGVVSAVDKLMRLPTVVKAAVMPDACPAGLIPVGGVIATKDAIHPGMHSADTCCSMALTIFNRNDNPTHVLDVAQKITHFGPVSRSRIPKAYPSAHLMEMIKGNPFLSRLAALANSGFMTQGDGNHFLFVGHLESTGELCLVTHHGSRNLGAQLYKHGMAAAQRHTKIIAPRVDPRAAWLDTTRQEGYDYWEALQLVRAWTKENHFAIHDHIARALGNKVNTRLWNEHNFVFRRTDGLFYHAKGATPSYSGFSPDDEGVTIIPMNMAEPILLTRHTDQADALGFAPHGAGRNMSRTAFLRENRPTLPAGIDVRSYCGTPDLSELPEAYKSAAHVTRIIQEQNLAEIFDKVIPYGSIMAGDVYKDAKWRKGKKQ